jgi:asparagine synthase (glutamine-hydrolysing)
MCGIAGLIATDIDQAEIARRARAMADAITYRGPDGSGVWSEEGVGLAHRRLAIVDLTPSGTQPMVSADGRWVISYNGEVYNAAAIAALMPDLVRRGTSDTEVIIESIAQRGLERTLADLNGMFAIALWDRANRTLHLIRDRLGIKPLFYTQTRDGTAFASELKAFAAGGFSFDIDGASVASFLRFGYVPTPHSIWKGVNKLRPGEVASFTPGRSVRRQLYWNMREIAERGVRAPFLGSDREAEERLADLLLNAVSANMISDVPLGAFLSGGIDSSTIAALMTVAKRGSVRTFSIGFPDFGYDESAHARVIAGHLGTQHQELMVTAADALAVVPHLADMYDEPFADSSQIPTFVISNMTRAHVAVALSGDGGDELFAGYNRYVLAGGRLARIVAMPQAVRGVSASLLDRIPENIVDLLARGLPAAVRPAMPADKLKKLAEVLRLDRDSMYLRLVSQNPDPAKLTQGLCEHAIDMPGLEPAADALARMQLFDCCTYLPDDILQKVDRASMSVSLEVRPPLLDHRVVEFAWSLPRHMLLRGGETKWLLRRVLDRYVPPALVERPKMGFGVPLASWLRGELRDWAEDLLDPQRMGGGLLDVGAVRSMWREHVSGRRNWAYGLWTLLMFEAWRRRWHDQTASKQMRAPLLAKAN